MVRLVMYAIQITKNQVYPRWVNLYVCP
jgi:hypothetical protein